MKHICIYCTTEKNEEEFNREHVVPRMMGRYNDAPVLGNYQVCKECNTFFSQNLEAEIGIDSYEALLRMKSGTKRLGRGTKLKSNRLSIVCQKGIFKGLHFTPVANPDILDGVSYEIEPCIGIKISNNEYEYYSIEALPMATTEIIQRLKEFEKPIIEFGYKKEKVEFILREKGYIGESYTYTESDFIQEFGEKDFPMSINVSIDSIMRRISAKTIFNYICYNTSAMQILDKKYDDIRKYIRYGDWNAEKLWFRYSIGYISEVSPPNHTSHVIGTMLHLRNGVWELLGCITWFGSMTYIMKICDLTSNLNVNSKSKIKILLIPDIDTKFTYFNNETREITEEEARFIYEKK